MLLVTGKLVTGFTVYAKKLKMFLLLFSCFFGPEFIADYNGEKNQRSTIRTFRFIASLVTDFGKMTGTVVTGSTVYTNNSKCSYFDVFILFLIQNL